MRGWLPALLLLLPCALSAQGFSVQGSANSARAYSLDGVTMPAFSISAGYQPGKHGYYGLRFDNSYAELEDGVIRRNALSADVRFYLTKGWYAGASLGVAADPGGSLAPAWSLTLLGTRQSLGHGLYLCTEFAVGNVAPGMFFGVGYSPLYQKKRDRNPVADRWELEAGFPFFVYAGYRLRKNVSVGLTAESYHKQMKWEGTKLPTGYSLWALEARFYFLQLGGFALYSATGGGMARLDPENRDTSLTWFWDNTLLGVRQRIHGRVYALGELKSGSLAFGGRLGIGIRI